MNTEDHDYDRMNMWCDIFGNEYLHWDKNKRKRAKINYAEERGLMPHQVTLSNITVNTGGYINCYSDDILQYSIGTGTIVGAVTLETKENEMYNVENNTETKQRDYLKRRADTINTEKFVDGQKAFGLRNDYPETQKQMLDWVLAGRYVYDAGHDRLEWRDPAIVRDPAGFEAWEKKLDAAHTAVKDAAYILPVQDALKAVQEFETATIQ